MTLIKKLALTIVLLNVLIFLLMAMSQQTVDK